MPDIYDNIEQHLLQALQKTLKGATRADFCVGYFNLRGWSGLASLADEFQGTGDSCCRVLVGMQEAPREQMRRAQSATAQDGAPDLATIKRRKLELTQSFVEQLRIGVPTKQALHTLQTLACQLREGKVCVGLFLEYSLHAKLYLIHRPELVPIIGFVGSSNLTQMGLHRQGELNVDVLEQDLARKLSLWFQARWNDEHAYDISQELAQAIEESWARVVPARPYHVYLKMAYHLCEDARAGERDFRMPPILAGKLLDFQAQAVALAARTLHRRNGVLLGDVVGLGKTLMAVAVAKIMETDSGGTTLIICPPKLEEMWQWHKKHYKLNAEVISLGRVTSELPELPPYSLVVIDESHNLRNSDSKRYRAVRDYLERIESDTFTPRVMLLSATPYNKHFSDLGAQIRLFIDENEDLHVRPEKFFERWNATGRNEDDFRAQFQASPRSLRAFEKSDSADDWRDLMRLFLVRRTRGFIKRVYAKYDEEKRRHFVMLNGAPFYFPERVPRTATFVLDENDGSDPYARLYSNDVVGVIEQLALPRYGLKQHLISDAERIANDGEKRVLENLTRAGRRLVGFCRTNLFKRLESSGHSFLLSLERHIMRNLVAAHALQNGLPIPIGAQDAALLDAFVEDEDVDVADIVTDDDEQSDEEVARRELAASGSLKPQKATAKAATKSATLEVRKAQAKSLYDYYARECPHKFSWLSPKLFQKSLLKALSSDVEDLHRVLESAGEWQSARDAKLHELARLLGKEHARDKVLVFTQFADTAVYLREALHELGVKNLEIATSNSSDPVALARRFSPETNGGLKDGESAIRVLVATDVLSEGQNLQDAHIIVNYDLPWAIIRLIQRAGRVDRIGQKHDTIDVYSFVPADGVEKVIGLRKRLSDRLTQNHEVIGSDEAFFGDEAASQLRDVFTGKQGVFDDDKDDDVDLSSVALQVWNSATEADRAAAENLPPIVAAAREVQVDANIEYSNVMPKAAAGAISYLRFPDGSDALVRVNEEGEVVSQSVSGAFAAAACAYDTPALDVPETHHALVERAVVLAGEEQFRPGGQLGSLRSTRRKVYERLKLWREMSQNRPNLFSQGLLAKLEPAMKALYVRPLLPQARDSLGRQLRLGIGDEALAQMTIDLYEDERLCAVQEDNEHPEPHIMCSLALCAPKQN